MRGFQPDAAQAGSRVRRIRLPESNAASFALLVYASSWIKCHYPDVFCAAILNASRGASTSRPSSYAMRARPASRCARQTSFSAWDCTLERASDGAQHRFAVRLGFRQIQGLNEDELGKLIAARGNGYAGIERLAALAGVSRFTIERLAEADAFRSLGLDRRAALWAARRLDTIGVRKVSGQGELSTGRPLPLLAPHMSDELFPEPEIALPHAACEHVAEDYVATGLSLKEHPISFFREAPHAARRHAQCRAPQRTLPQGRRIRSPPCPDAADAGSQRRRLHDAEDETDSQHHHGEGLRQEPPRGHDSRFVAYAGVCSARVGGSRLRRVSSI